MSIVFTNGCFDLFHAGHIHILKECKKIGDKLIVGLNTDDSVRRLKGNNRPIIKEEERLEILMSIKYVDHVLLFNELTPINLIKYIKPDIIVKGGDYNEEDVVGYGLSKIVIIPLIENVSTTKIIDKIRGYYANTKRLGL